MTPRTDSLKARGEAGPERPQPISVSKHRKNLEGTGLKVNGEDLKSIGSEQFQIKSASHSSERTTHAETPPHPRCPGQEAPLSRPRPTQEASPHPAGAAPPKAPPQSASQHPTQQAPTHPGSPAPPSSLPLVRDEGGEHAAVVQEQDQEQGRRALRERNDPTSARRRHVCFLKQLNTYTPITQPQPNVHKQETRVLPKAAQYHTYNPTPTQHPLGGDTCAS